jgi:hypothetical protein
VFLDPPLGHNGLGLLHPNPAFFRPQALLGVASVSHKTEEVFVTDQSFINGKRVNLSLVKSEFIVPAIGRLQILQVVLGMGGRGGEGPPHGDVSFLHLNISVGDLRHF